MVYIDKKKFNICTAESFEWFKDDPELIKGMNADDVAFECDDLIAPVISLLNRKGYITEYCCQGHYQICEFVNPLNKDNYPDGIDTDDIGIQSYPYIQFDKCYTKLKNNIPNGWELKYCPMRLEDSIRRNNEGKKIEDDKKLRGVECKHTLRLNKSSDRYIKRIFGKNKEMDAYVVYCKFNEWIAKEMSRLYMWAVSLPDNR